MLKVNELKMVYKYCRTCTAPIDIEIIYHINNREQFRDLLVRFAAMKQPGLFYNEKRYTKRTRVCKSCFEFIKRGDLINNIRRYRTKAKSEKDLIEWFQDFAAFTRRTDL